ncbi:MAG: hypothetical protein K2M31_00515 [Muribaculaceae bacterium]|nr:hypothetical protein [Muribaculaceae bacterium]
MRRLLLFLSIIYISLTASGNREALRKLDEVIRDRAKYEIPKREAILKSRAEYESAADDDARYNALRGLYENYRSYRIDSALIVANQRLDIARRLGVASKIASASINLAEGYARSGSADIAIGILDTLNPASLQAHHYKYRNAVYREAYRSKVNTSVIPEEKEYLTRRLKTLNDSALTGSDKTSKGYYTLTAEKLCDAGLYSEAIATIQEAQKHYDFSQDAAMLATIGDVYLKSGDRQKAIDYLASSAIIDISSGTKEYHSLITLTSLLLEQGDVKRAFEYINCAFEDAEFSHANLRTAQIMKIMPAIDKAFHESEREKRTLTTIFLIIAGILVIVCLLLLAWYVKALHENRRMLATIEEINKSLAEKNAALADADSLKLHNINMLMKANSEYIARIKALRKNIYRCLKANQYDKALEFAKDKQNEINDIYVFQGLFDEAFISMFPDFIDKVNIFMREKIEPKESGRLTPELRVIAMMKLRMGSTEEISSLFHYSNQTVYNLRTSIRNILNISWDEFEKKIDDI